MAVGPRRGKATVSQELPLPHTLQGCADVCLRDLLVLAILALLALACRLGFAALIGCLLGRFHSCLIHPLLSPSAYLLLALAAAARAVAPDPRAISVLRPPALRAL